jgi:hypothetical protein
MAVEDEARQLDAVRITLEREFSDRVPADVIARHFTDIVSAYEGVPVRTFLPVLVHRQAKALLSAGG